MPNDLTVPLQTHLEKVCCAKMQALMDRIEAHKREHELLDKALEKAEANIHEKHGIMNEVRAQILEERGEMATKTMMRAEFDGMRAKVDAVRVELIGRIETSHIIIDGVQRSMANMEGRAWALTIAIPLMISALVSLAIKLL